MAIRIFNRPNVWVRRNWEDAWVAAALGFSAIGSTAPAAPGIGSASFYWDYGFLTDQGVPAYYAAPPFPYLGWFVQIRVTIDETETEMWTGRFVADGLDIDGTLDNGVGTGQQRYEAVELSYLLERFTIRDAVAIQDEQEVDIDRVPQMNRSTDRGLSTIGNRSDSPNEDEIYRYSTDGAVWTHRQFLEMQLWDNRPGGIQFVLTGQEGLLDYASSSGRVEGLTLLSLLDGLINRQRGFVWKIDKVGFGRAPVVEIKIATVFDEEITVGSVTLSPNPEIIDWDLGNANENEEIRLSLVDVNSFDTIRVRGGRIVSCFTIDNNVFVKAWTDAEEGYYKDGAKNEEGYDELDEEEQITENERYRSQPRFDPVYRQWVMPLNWNWHLDYVDPDPEVEVEKYHVNPKPDISGGLIEGEPSKFFNDGRHFLKKLPLKRGWDYTDSEPFDRRPPDMVSEYSSTMVWVKHDDDKYYKVTRLSQIVIDDDDNKASSCSLKVLDKQMGFELASPGHQFAKGHFEGAEPTGSLAVFDWENLIATVAVETDQRVEVVEEAEEPIAGGAGRTLVIDLPYAKLWWIAPHTVVGIDAAGKKEVYGGSSNILRNDGELLEGVAAAALGWYGKRRQTLSVTVVYLTDAARVGDLIRSLTLPNIYQDINTVVTQVVHDYIAGRTTVVTNYAQLDFAEIPMGHRDPLGSSDAGMGPVRGGKAVIGGSGAGISVMGAGSLMDEVAALKEELGDLPSELAVTGGGGGSVMRVAEVDSNATGGGYYNCKLQKLDADDWESNTGLFDDKADGAIVALNIPEAGRTDSHHLNANDKMAVWRQRDDGDPGKMRWIGVEINYLERCT